MNRILIIDDDKDMRTIINEILSLQGYVTSLASDGSEGVCLFKAGSFDLVITDIIMPGQEGIETIIEIKNFKSKIKIIAISGGGRINAEDHLSVASRVGADATLTKPFRSHELIEIVEKLIGSPG